MTWTFRTRAHQRLVSENLGLDLANHSFSAMNEAGMTGYRLVSGHVVASRVGVDNMVDFGRTAADGDNQNRWSGSSFDGLHCRASHGLDNAFC